MSAIRFSGFTRFFVVPMTLAALVSGCSYKWTDVRPPFERTIAEVEPGHARVTLKNGRAIELASPILERDTLFGDVPLLQADLASHFNVTMEARGNESVARAAIPVTDILRFEARKADNLKNVGRAAGVLLGAALLVATVATISVLQEVGEIDWGGGSRR